ncbi:MAG: glycosyltransferase family 39 protein [Vicinamibacteria bacterium]
MALPRLPRWAGTVFALALAARLAFLVLADQPLLYSHQYTYFTAAMRIAEHPQALAYVLRSDEWRVWDQHWTIAPLYHVFAGAVFKLFGPHLLALRLVQCLLDAVAAVGVAWLGRRVAGPRGLWAGVAYAVYWPAVEMPTWTMTENAHTVLFVSAVVLLARETAQPSRRLAFAGGALVGLSALARSVSTVFLGLAALQRAYAERSRRGLVSAALVLLGGAAVVLPWTARNVFLIGEPVLIESAAFENIWYANHLVDRPAFLAQEREVHGQPTPAAKRARALAFALDGIRQRPGAFADKVRANFWHFLRLEGLHNLLRIERSLEPWRHAGTVLLDDLVFLACIPLFVVFAIAGRPSPARRLILTWCAYYVFMVVVVFHNEIRYRSAFVPFAFAGAAGGAMLLASAAERGRWRVRLAATLGLALGAAMIVPYTGPGLRAVRAFAAVRQAVPPAAAGDNVGAWLRAEQAAARDPRSPRPWLLLARHHAWGDRPQPALAALDRARPLSTVANWSVAIARPRIWTAVGQTKDGIRAARTLDTLSWDTDPWLVLEIAWRDLPPPVADRIQLGDGFDYGAVRGFLHPRGAALPLHLHRLEWDRYDLKGGPQPPSGTHRFSRRRAWLRLRPATAAAAYDVTLTMGAPFPSTLSRPRVTVTAGGRSQAFTLDAELRAYTLAGVRPASGVVEVALDAPTWSRAGEPADQGVRVDRLEVAPSTSP